MKTCGPEKEALWTERKAREKHKGVKNINIDFTYKKPKR
jgi:hypothetical protein